MNADRLQFEASLEHLYGRGVARHLPWEKMSYVRSRKSQRMKKVLSEGRLLATVREEGSVAYTLECARYLMKSATFKDSCIVVNDDAAEFVVKGKSLFSKHVVTVGKNVNPGLEVCLLDSKGRLLAVGKAILPREYMGVFKSGAAVRVREGAHLAASGKHLNDKSENSALT
jgi:uncharacterized protein with predicted RNA binding PUA domain